MEINIEQLVNVGVFKPSSLEVPGGWCGHLPFASWVIQERCPKIFVELGTHSGNSYFAFCQAVKENNLAARCYAVDTWQGDEHAGHYDEFIFRKVATHNEEDYSSFSTLMRMSFDDASKYFSNGTIELLHIDGLHTYEAVKYDFESWLPKLAPGAVVLFHDTNVRERGFGVWKLWEELQELYPNNIEFFHSHGLGILQLNDASEGTKLNWLKSESTEKGWLRDYFSKLGENQFERYVGKHARIQNTSLNQSLSEREGENASLNQLVSERDHQIVSLNKAVSERDHQVASLTQLVSDRNHQLASLKQIIVDKDVVSSALSQNLNKLIHSHSWRLTAPLRAVFLAGRVVVLSPCKLLRKIGDRSLVWRQGDSHSALRQIRNSSLFDANYYLAANPDVSNAGMDPAEHYLLHGWIERRDPSAAFSTSQYLIENPDVARAQVNPLVHYLQFGLNEGRTLALHKNSGDMSPTGALAGIAPTADQATIDEEVAVIKKSGLFSESFYRVMNPDLQPPPCDAIRHYCEIGWREGRDPSDDFDTLSYLKTYSDIRNAGINPLWHYVVHGASELRQAVPHFVRRLENDIRFGEIETDIKMLAYFSSPNWASLRARRSASKGNSQPFLPLEELGFYDPLDWQVLKNQAQMAKDHGLYGFCFQLSDGTDRAGLPQPLDIFLVREEIDFRFCVQADLHSASIEDILVSCLVRAVSDKRCIRVEGRPVIVAALPGDKEHAANAISQLRSKLVENGVGSVFLIGQMQGGEDRLDESLVGQCDAMLDLPGTQVETDDFLPLDKNGINVVPYSVVASRGIARAIASQLLLCRTYPSVTLGRDNTAQEGERPLVYSRFNLGDYRRWLDAAISSARSVHPEDRRFVFVNAWNNWNEGLSLEPDRLGGFGRVNEATRALLNFASDTTMPKVSVIVPNYNHERFLRRRLDSIYGQTYKNIEVILLDDCSSDRSRSVLDEYANKYPEITLALYNDTNSGGSFRQWTKGIKAATGELVWIAESDDFCDERFLEVLIHCFDDEAVLLAYAKCVFVDQHEVPMRDEFKTHLSDLDCAEKWNSSYVETAHNEVRSALGIKNTIPNASGVLFKRPTNMSLLEDESWLSMVVAGDWVFYLHIIHGGKIAYSTDATNFFRRYEGSVTEVACKKEVFYREVGFASRTVAKLYNVPLAVFERCKQSFENLYFHHVNGSQAEFSSWYDYDAVLRARECRLPNVMVSTMGFYPGGAEILPIRMANEFKRQGLSVLLLNAGLNPHEEGVRKMLRSDIPLVETPDVEAVRSIIHDFGIEALNSHQWHIQKYPLHVSDVFSELGAHVASLHGMIEHGEAFGVTEEQLLKADQNVTTWVYTADKNIVPFSDFGLYNQSSGRFVKLPNGMPHTAIKPVPRMHMNIPEEAFVLCCVSRAILDKGWAEAILVVERARELSGRDIRLILVGNGPVYDEYCKGGAPDFVYLAGFSENSVGYYAAADMGIMLTKFKSESFPLTIVDCLFAGKPYFASDVGDIRNMLTDSNGMAGAVVKLEDWEVPIERAAEVVMVYATDHEKYENALALVQDIANRYRIDVVTEKYVRLFQRDINLRHSRSNQSRIK